MVRAAPVSACLAATCLVRARTESEPGPRTPSSITNENVGGSVMPLGYARRRAPRNRAQANPAAIYRTVTVFKDGVGYDSGS